MAGRTFHEPAAPRGTRQELNTVDALAGIDRAVAVATVPVAIAGGYLGALSLAARRPQKPIGDESVRFAVVIPAHNEELGIARTVENVRACRYPAARCRIVVIADNCTDATARIARNAGAEVVERFDDSRRSKGYALTDVLPKVLEDQSVDAVVIIDADSRIDPDFLRTVGSRIADGAQVVQADYQVDNRDDSWRTTLMAVAFTCFHEVRSLGRERLRLSAGLRGNGMAFTRSALESVPHQAASLVEDLEQGIAFAEKGIRVWYAHDAKVLAEMPATEGAAGSQRKRWEQGRAEMRRLHGARLIREALRRRDRVLADLAMDVLLPPLGTVAAATAAAGGAAAVLSGVRGRAAVTAVPAGIAVVGLAGHVALGWRRSGTGVAGLRALGHVPKYLLWKSGLSSGSADADKTWVRTTRKAEETIAAEHHASEPVAVPLKQGA